MGTQRIPNRIRILIHAESNRLGVLVGFRSSLMPQYRLSGNAIIPAHVNSVPKGIDLFGSIASVSREEPVAKSRRVLNVTIRAL